MNRIKQLLSILFLCLLMPIYAQQAPTVTLVSYNELMAKYVALLDEHETTLTDYDTLLTDYSTLLVNYNKLKGEYKDLTDKFTLLTGQHELDIKFHEGTKLSLLAANRTIENLEVNVKQLLTIADTKYFAVYPQLGYAGSIMTGGIGMTAQFPKFPISVMIDVNYVSGLTNPIDIQFGIGIKF